MSAKKISKIAEAGLTKVRLQQACNKATKKLLDLFSYKSSGKQSLEYALIGWAESDYLEFDDKKERSSFVAFVLQLSRHLQEIEVLDEQAPDEAIALENFAFFEQYNHKQTKLFFKSMLLGFIEEDIANNKDIRFTTVYDLKLVKKYSLSVIKLLN